jgi:hypothetical protein
MTPGTVKDVIWKLRSNEIVYVKIGGHHEVWSLEDDGFLAKRRWDEDFGTYGRPEFYVAMPINDLQPDEKLLWTLTRPVDLPVYNGPD